MRKQITTLSSFLLQCKVVYAMATAMKRPNHSAQQRFLLSACVCLLVAGCGASPSKRSDVLDIYELPRAGQGATIYTAPVDNDSYYVQPQGYKGCAQVNDAPSCGGG